MITGQDSVPLDQNERNIDRVGDFRIGTPVRWTDMTLAEMRAAGISVGTRRSYLAGGSVTQIVESEQGFWVSVRIRLDAPFTHEDGTGGDHYAWASPVDLQTKE